MKLYLTALAAAALLFSCKRATLMDKVNESQLKTYFTTTILKRPNAVLDSFRLISVDTLTAKNGYVSVSRRLIAMVDYNEPELQRQLEKGRNSYKRYQLIANNPYAGNLRQILKDEYETAYNKVKEINSRNKLLVEDAKKMIELEKNADKKQLIAYLSKSIYQLKRADFSTERDTAYILLNKEFNIINNRDFIKALPPFTLVSGVDVTE